MKATINKKSGSVVLTGDEIKEAGYEGIKELIEDLDFIFTMVEERASDEDDEDIVAMFEDEFGKPYTYMVTDNSIMIKASAMHVCCFITVFIGLAKLKETFEAE